MKSEIDFNRMVNTDDMDTALDQLRGVVAILQALELTHDMGQHLYDKYAYLVLGKVCNDVIDDFAGMYSDIEYMEEKIREG